MEAIKGLFSSRKALGAMGFNVLLIVLGVLGHVPIDVAVGAATAVMVAWLPTHAYETVRTSAQALEALGPLVGKTATPIDDRAVEIAKKAGAGLVVMSLLVGCSTTCREAVIASAQISETACQAAYIGATEEERDRLAEICPIVFDAAEVVYNHADAICHVPDGQ